MKASLIYSDRQQIARVGFLFLFFLLSAQGIFAATNASSHQAFVKLAPGVTSREIQQALDALPPSGGEVRLPAGKIQVLQPIVLRRDSQTLSGAGATTILSLADNANCPVVIMGEPVNHPKRTVEHLGVRDLVIDGNRLHQQRELWQLSGEGSEVRNNGVTVQGVSDSSVENVTCENCRSGGLVTTLGVSHLTVRGLNSFGNQFDGLACYLTTYSLFADLHLHDNPCAGISLDLAFNFNVISNAVLDGNDLGIFMRDSRDNQFHNVTISSSHHFGVFMAQAGIYAPDSYCRQNAFTNLAAEKCGSAAFRVNDPTCIENTIISPKFVWNAKDGLSQVRPDLVAVQ